MQVNVNTVIDRFRNTNVYELLKNYYVNDLNNQEECFTKYNAVVNTLFNYYLNKYKFINYFSEEIQYSLISAMRQYNNLLARTKIVDGFLKVYPIEISAQEHEINYNNILREIVEYQIETGLPIEEIFKKYTSYFTVLHEQYKNKIINTNMKPYYGSPSYMINRAKFIKKCIDNIPNVEVNIDDIVAKMEGFERKYSNSSVDVDEQFVIDYDNLEEYYKLVLHVENELCPIVAEYWKQYLTDPKNHNSNDYKYVLHTFSSGFVDPNTMNKACCALNTDELVITPYGTSGLIYDVDVNSIETACSQDVGSWNCSKKEFIDRGCPITWQLTNTEGISVWYEEEENSKLVMPDVIEKECQAENVSYNGERLDYNKAVCYSEIYLNSNAKAIGVFYTDNCPNYDEVVAYAQKYNLPLVHISLIHQRELKGLPALESGKKI